MATADAVLPGAEVTLTSVFAIEKMQASKHEVEHALAEGIAIRGGLAPVAVVRDAGGRATALRAAREGHAETLRGRFVEVRLGRQAEPVCKRSLDFSGAGRLRPLLESTVGRVIRPDTAPQDLLIMLIW